MGISSIHFNRVSQTLRSHALTEALRQSTASVLLQQNRLTSGRNFTAPSEDPVAASQTLRISEFLQSQEQFTQNIRHADGFLAASEAALTDINEILLDAQTIASRNTGNLTDPDEREAAAQLVAEIHDQLVNVANRQYQGVYLFAGRRANTQPFVSALGGAAYQGDDGDLATLVSPGESSPYNIPGDRIFGLSQGTGNSVAGTVDLDPALTADVRLDDLAGAARRGVTRGSLRISEDGGAGAIVVDLSAADTIGDVVDLINSASEGAGSELVASLSTSGLVITPGAGTTVSITGAGGSTAAEDLGIVRTAADSAVIDGLDLGVKLTMTTRIADLLGGAGIELTDPLRISNGNASADVDLSAAETIQDIINAINQSGLYVRARINPQGNGLDVVNTVSGTTLSIGEAGGETATLLGLRTLTAATPLSALNDGRGVETLAGQDDLVITARDGTEVPVNLDGAETIQDVIDLINEAAAGAGVAVSAGLVAFGNGIEITDETGGDGPLSVSRAGPSYAAEDLGLEGSVADPDLALVSTIHNGVRLPDALTALVDLEQALRGGDARRIGAAGEALQSAVVEINRVRGTTGSRAQAMQRRLQVAEDANTASETLLSQIRDVDYAAAITQLQQHQLALQAGLQTGAQLLNVSLLDFLV